ncbi:hypothetical protein QWZ13_00660 [Reinekea marina]|nr:hypothetical protein [Reinekea marina]MDN3647414.1 hypothetical protein [Reinekea marina]
MSSCRFEYAKLVVYITMCRLIPRLMVANGNFALTLRRLVPMV